MRAGYGSNGLRGSVSRQEINFETILRDFRRGGVQAGKPIVIVVDVEAAVLGNDDPAAEEIRAEPFGLPAQFHSVENATDIVPAVRPDEAFFAIDEFLAPDFQRNGKFLVIAYRDVGLMKID